MLNSAVTANSNVYEPETLLKKKKTTERQDADISVAKADEKKIRALNRSTIFKRAEAYVREYQQRERDEVRLRRQAKSAGNLYVPSEPKLLFVIRIKGINDVHPKVQKVLELFRLLRINNGVFVRLNKATAQMLQIIEPYVTYGPPNLKTVRELLYKRGFLKIDGQRIPITDNDVIAKALSKNNIICVEDIIHEIFTVGEHFKEVNRILWPFKLNNPTGSWERRKFRHYVEGGSAGDRENNINRLVQSMI